ncbi:MAG: hypothetical protein IPK16_16275 [Anaerolineales bacterium]|nr:hypothetical protein [Anaerolineales bacterium]
MRSFRYGAAALAVHASAQMAPVFATISLDGRVTFEIREPLSSGIGNEASRVERLTRAYVDLVMQHWPHVYPEIYWGHLMG